MRYTLFFVSCLLPLASDGVTNSLKSFTGCGVWGDGCRGRSGAGGVATGRLNQLSEQLLSLGSLQIPCLDAKREWGKPPQVGAASLLFSPHPTPHTPYPV
ncbi:hypothetical protein [Moorena producens]|uniref:hypothetical protein n=1 Tax=Moorena producens TaxID=1155739 RepID=UPI0011EA6DEA|nr:hypothetical protein [Moorena producens]